VKNIYHGGTGDAGHHEGFRSVRTAIRRGAKSDVEFAGGERILLRVFDIPEAEVPGCCSRFADSCR